MVLSVAISNKNKYMASGGCDRKITLWNVENGLKIREFTNHKSYI